jgi:Flp pilus assembly protein TadG
LRVRFFRDDLGQSLVEVALFLPLLAFVVLGGADMARAYAVQLAVQDGARAGAEAAAVDQSPTVSKAQARALDEMGRTPGLDPNRATVVVTLKQQGGLIDCVNPPTILIPCYATVEAKYTFNTITPWPLIPNQFAFDRTTTMRMFAAP